MAERELIKTAIIGSGSLGEQFVHYISEIGEPDSVYFDYPMFERNVPGSFAFKDHKIFDFDSYKVYIGLGYKHLALKEEIYDFLKLKSVNTPNYFHASCYLSKKMRSGDANFVFPMCSFEKDVVLGKGNVFNSNCSVSHDSEIGDFNFFGPGVTVSGVVQMGDRCFVGAGSVITNGVKIGNNVIIGAGTVVSKDIPNNTSVVGNPMRVLTEKLNLS